MTKQYPLDENNKWNSNIQKKQLLALIVICFIAIVVVVALSNRHRAEFGHNNKPKREPGIPPNRPAIEYQQIPTMCSIMVLVHLYNEETALAQSLSKTISLWNDGHYDYAIIEISTVFEAQLKSALGYSPNIHVGLNKLIKEARRSNMISREQQATLHAIRKFRNPKVHSAGVTCNKANAEQLLLPAISLIVVQQFPPLKSSPKTTISVS